MPLFDAYIFVDWNARHELCPTQSVVHAIWTGELIPGEGYEDQQYFRGREVGFQHIKTRLMHHIELEHRVLVGFDFAYGYPCGLASALYMPNDHSAWWNIWTELVARMTDGPGNISNRFEVASSLNEISSSSKVGPFWGVSSDQATDHLMSNSPAFPFVAKNGTHLKRFRITEDLLSGVPETWKLSGSGSVGRQALAGIPYLYRLRRHVALASVSRVWPFETGFTPTPVLKAGPCVVHAEIWPGIVNKAVAQIANNETGAIRDKIQVYEMCKWAADLDRDNGLGKKFDTPPSLDRTEIESCIQHEGWILGV